MEESRFRGTALEWLRHGSRLRRSQWEWKPPRTQWVFFASAAVHSSLLGWLWGKQVGRSSLTITSSDARQAIPPWTPAPAPLRNTKHRVSALAVTARIPTVADDDLIGVAALDTPLCPRVTPVLRHVACLPAASPPRPFWIWRTSIFPSSSSALAPTRTRPARWLSSSCSPSSVTRLLPTSSSSKAASRNCAICA